MKPSTDKIKVGAIEYTLVEIPQLPDLGIIDLAQQTIGVRAGIPKDLKAWTIWHEIIHAILYSNGHISGHDEVLVDALAHGLVQVLRENPAIKSL